MPPMPSPDPNGLPAPVWILKSLSIGSLSAHLIAMNLVLGGVAILVAAYPRARNSPFHAVLVERVARWLPIAMALTITLGVAPLLFVQVLYGQAFYASSVLMGWPWLCVMPLLLVAYVGLYAVAYRPEALARRTAVVAWASATAILGVGLLFSGNWQLMLQPGAWLDAYRSSPSAYIAARAPAFWPRFAHIALSAPAVAAVGLMLLARGIRPSDPDWSDRALRVGNRWFQIAMGLNVLVGVGFLMSLPALAVRAFAGGSQVDSLILGAGVLLALVAMSIGRRSPVATACLLAASVVAMVVVRHRLRTLMLAGYLDVNALPVKTQWPLIATFVIVLGVGLLTIVWMLARLTAANRKRRRREIDRLPGPSQDSAA